MIEDTPNYFALLNMQQSFDIDRSKLDASYRQLQQQSHPDRFVNEATAIQRNAVQQTALNGEAFRILKSAVLRACHLLNVLDIEFSLDNYTVTDIELLMQQMEYRESLDEIKESADVEKLDVFGQKLKMLIVDIQQAITKLFKSIDKDYKEENLTLLKNNICELQFLNKLTLDLDEVEEQLFTLQ